MNKNSTQTQIVVLGGGIAGLAAAARLVHKGEKPVIIEEGGKKVPFSGIGISFGAGKVNCVLAYRGLSVIGMSVARAGDFIDKKVSVWKYLLVIFSLVFLNIIFYPLATQIRIGLAPAYYNNQNPSLKDTIESIKKSFYDGGDADGLQLYNRRHRFLSVVLNRLGVIDYPILMKTYGPDKDMKDKYLTWQYASKSIANTLLPGVIFQDAQYNTSRLVSVLFRNLDEKYLGVGGYFSEFYTIWGIIGLLCGWVQGLFVLFLIGVGMQFFYWLFSLFDSLNVYMCSLYLFIVPLLTYGSMGIDHTLSNIFLLFIAMGIILLIIEFLTRLSKKIKER